MEIDKKIEKNLLDSFNLLKSDIEDCREIVIDNQRMIDMKYAKYITLRKVFEDLGIKYTKIEGDDQNAFI